MIDCEIEIYLVKVLSGVLCLILKGFVLDNLIVVFVYDLLKVKDVIYFGCGVYYLIVMEGVLKLKEISYIYVEGYVSGEFKYGLIVLIDEVMLVVFVVLYDCLFDKLLFNL